MQAHYTRCDVRSIVFCFQQLPTAPVRWHSDAELRAWWNAQAAIERSSEQLGLAAADEVEDLYDETVLWGAGSLQTPLRMDVMQ